jgi:hypothetical protein
MKRSNKKPVDLSPCAPHLIAVYFADREHTPSAVQQRELCDEIWERYSIHDRMVMALRELVSVVRIHSEATDNNFAWAELEECEKVLSKIYEDGK